MEQSRIGGAISPQAAAQIVRYVLRLWLDDRPGVLGQIASAIGQAGGDVEGIDILERDGGQAIDEIVVAMPRVIAQDILIAALEEIDGVRIEDLRTIGNGRLEPATAALAGAQRLADRRGADVYQPFCAEIMGLFDTEWSALIDRSTDAVVASLGVPPDLAWMIAFLEGSDHLDALNRDGSVPSDVVWSGLTPTTLAFVAGRGGRPFHVRERQHAELLAQIAGSLITPA